MTSRDDNNHNHGNDCPPALLPLIAPSHPSCSLVGCCVKLAGAPAFLPLPSRFVVIVFVVVFAYCHNLRYDNKVDDHNNVRGPSLPLPPSDLIVASRLHPPLPRQRSTTISIPTAIPTRVKVGGGAAALAALTMAMTNNNQLEGAAEEMAAATVTGSVNNCNSNDNCSGDDRGCSDGNGNTDGGSGSVDDDSDGGNCNSNCIVVAMVKAMAAAMAATTAATVMARGTDNNQLKGSGRNDGGGGGNSNKNSNKDGNNNDDSNDKNTNADADDCALTTATRTTRQGCASQWWRWRQCWWWGRGVRRQRQRSPKRWQEKRRMMGQISHLEIRK